jgi:glycerophosphoryl diester phosphodiesterase
LPAYFAAIGIGAGYNEVDVRTTTAAGRLVYMHNSTVDGTTNGKDRAGIYVDAERVSTKDLVAALEKYGMIENVVVHGGYYFLKELAVPRPKIIVMPKPTSVGIIRARGLHK